jgi:hypothetical protein
MPNLSPEEPDLSLAYASKSEDRYRKHGCYLIPHDDISDESLESNVIQKSVLLVIQGSTLRENGIIFIAKPKLCDRLQRIDLIRSVD